MERQKKTPKKQKKEKRGKKTRKRKIKKDESKYRGSFEVIDYDEIVNKDKTKKGDKENDIGLNSEKDDW